MNSCYVIQPIVEGGRVVCYRGMVVENLDLNNPCVVQKTEAVMGDSVRCAADSIRKAAKLEKALASGATCSTECSCR